MFPQKSILVATDLTEQCEPAMRIASDLAKNSGAALHVLHAFELRTNPYVQRAAARNAFQALLEEANDGLSEQIKLTIAGEVDLQSVTSEFYLPWKSIVQRARHIHAELIVMGPHEHVSGDRFLGATADRVIRFADAPCLIVRRGRQFAANCFVLAIDGSPATSAACQEAMSWTTRFACEHDCELHIIHAAADLPEVMAGQELIKAAVREARDELEGTHASVVGDVLCADDAASEIVNYADRVGADLLIMASSGHGAIDRLVTGSTTSAVASRTGCSLLIVPVRQGGQAVPNAAELLSWHLPLAPV